MSAPPASPPDSPPPAATPEPPAATLEAAAQPRPLAPADILPPPTLRQRFVWYAGAMLLSCLLVTLGMQLWNRDLRAPFYYDLDSLLYLPMTRAVVEQGFWNGWHVDRLGAPGTQELYDFPVIDFLHFAFLWAIGKVVPNLLLVYNLYSLMTYPLTVLTAMWVLRWLKLSLPAAALGGLLYAFLPYHQERYHYHYFLAAYWWVPVSMVPALAILKGDFPFLRRNPDGTYPPIAIDWRAVWANLKGAVRFRRAAWGAILVWCVRVSLVALRELFTWRVLSQILIGAVTGSAGAYYAFFACACYAFAGVYGWVIHRTWRAAASAALVIAPVFAVGLAYHLPTFIYHYQNGANRITQRFPHEADSYGLKVAHLLLPANDHNFTPLANLRLRYGTPERPAEGESAGSFGFFGGFGLIALLGIAFLPRKRLWPEGAMSALTLYLVLLGTIGAMGSLFNILVTPQIRAYNRVSVFIALPCFFIVLWWLDRFLVTRTGLWMKRARYPILGLLLIACYFDQTPWGWNPFNPNGMEKIDLFAERFQADKKFFREIEELAPAGTKVFCLPYSPFPESPPVHKMGAYEHARGYIMTDTLYWSFGAIKGREADAWNKDVALAKPDEMLRRVVARGFDGLLIDGRGYQTTKDGDKAAALIARINDLYLAVAGPRAGRLPQIAHADGKQFFLDLRPYREAYRHVDPIGYARSEREEAEWVAPLWLNGFATSNPTDDGGELLHWGAYDSQLTLLNPTDRPRTFKVSFIIGVDVAGPFEVAIGPPINDLFTLDKINDPNDPLDLKRHGTRKEYRVQLAPGRNVIDFRCKPPDYFQPLDRRNLCFFLKEFTLQEQ